MHTFVVLVGAYFAIIFGACVGAGPGAYFKNEIHTSFGDQQRSCKRSEPRYARQCEIRLAPEPGPHNRTYQVLSKQPGPGAYETVTGHMGKDPIKPNSPGFA
eukprot:8695175-Pyramimonas_sp.AAC.1